MHPSYVIKQYLPSRLSIVMILIFLYKDSRLIVDFSVMTRDRQWMHQGFNYSILILKNKISITTMP